MAKLKITDCKLFKAYTNDYVHKEEIIVSPDEIDRIDVGNGCIYIVLLTGSYIKTENIIKFI